MVIVGDNIETDYGQIYNITAPLHEISFEEVLKIGKIVRKNVKVNRVIALVGQEVSIEQIITSIERREDRLIGVNSPKSGVYKKGYQARHLGYGVDPEKQICRILTKAEIISQTINGNCSTKVPPSILQVHLQVTIIIDKEISHHLKKRKLLNNDMYELVSEYFDSNNNDD